MTRRDLLFTPAAAFAQTQFPGVAYRNYARCLPDFLRDLAARAYQKRNAGIAKLTTSDAIHARQRWVRETFWELAGGMPERTPLNARTVGTFDREGYRVEKIVYESQPKFYVPANLYVPTSARPPFPGVLFQMGHSLNGKAADTYQRCCQALGRLGYLVLAFDPMGQGERLYYPDSGFTRTRLASADSEHTLPGKQMLLLGFTSTRLQVWDAIRSLDYLATHPLVDPKRLGGTGQSGGGTLTMLLLAVDDRLAAGAIASGNTENFACANFNPPGSTDDAEQNFLGSGPLGFDRWDLLYPFAPKPLLISVSDKDFFGTYSPAYISNGWEEYQKLKKVYTTLGHGSDLAWADTPLPHGLSYDSRLHIYNWFGRHLKGDSAPVEQEPPVAPEADKTLWVSESGNVVKSLESETPFTLNRARAGAESRTSGADGVKRLLGIDSPGAARVSVLRRVPSRDVEIEAIEIAPASQVWTPAWLFTARADDPSRPVILMLDPSGRNSRWHEGELYQSLAARGPAVCVADIRGLGDSMPEYSRGDARYARSHQAEEDYAWASLMLGKSLLGQRVTDILAVAGALRAHRGLSGGLSGRRLVIAALGRLTVPALIAAALDPKIDALYLAGGLVSYRNLVQTEDYTYPLANIAPNLLKYADLPDLAATLAPRRVTLAGATDATGRTLDSSEVRRIYSAAERAGNLTVVQDPQWDLEAFAKWT